MENIFHLYNKNKTKNQGLALVFCYNEKMKITYTDKPKKGSRQINLYTKDSEKKTDTKTKLFVNFKIEEEYTRRGYITLIRSLVQRAKAHKLEHVCLAFADIKKINAVDVTNEDKAELLTSNLIIGQYRFDKFFSEKKPNIKTFQIVGKMKASEKKSAKEGALIANSVNHARDLANAPGGSMTPAVLASEARKMFKGMKKVRVKVLEEKDAKKLKMNLFLAVGQGSVEKSKFIIVEYKGGSPTTRPIALVGKGITFDTGGLNLKPGKSMDEMAMDMTGGATALCALQALAKLGVKKNIIAIVPAVENAISGSAFRPGDIIKSMSGKTVQIGNTDAEGRLVLADSITYAKRYDPKVLIDIATLTGASLVAVGDKASVVMTKNRDLENTLRDLGEKTGDYVWPLPTWEEFEADIKAPYADLLNIGKTRWGGAITAGMFLAEFAKDLKKTDWVHLDIAPRMESSGHDCLEKGATGEPVRLLVEFVKQYR